MNPFCQGLPVIRQRQSSFMWCVRGTRATLYNCGLFYPKAAKLEVTQIAAQNRDQCVRYRYQSSCYFTWSFISLKKN